MSEIIPFFYKGIPKRQTTIQLIIRIEVITLDDSASVVIGSLVSGDYVISPRIQQIQFPLLIYGLLVHV